MQINFCILYRSYIGISTNRWWRDIIWNIISTYMLKNIILCIYRTLYRKWHFPSFWIFHKHKAMLKIKWVDFSINFLRCVFHFIVLNSTYSKHFRLERSFNFQIYNDRELIFHDFLTVQDNLKFKWTSACRWRKAFFIFFKAAKKCITRNKSHITIFFHHFNSCWRNILLFIRNRLIVFL